MVNPNRNKDRIKNFGDKTFLEQVKMYPLFFSKLEFEVFRHIRNLQLNFVSPVTVITGSNKAGKTSVLLAIACSHYNFRKKKLSTGAFDRARWGDVMRFTSSDIQDEDWTYYVSYREGDKIRPRKRAQRKAATKKWNGVAKKESQIGTPTFSKPEGGRNVYLIDLERIAPARHLSVSVFNKAKNCQTDQTVTELNNYLSYILEGDYNISKIYTFSDNAIYTYNNKYSSYNTASGEDVLTTILNDIINAPDSSLILIDEIEVGLHPKIQRKLMDVILEESLVKHKQFIITTHSPSILSAVEPQSRIYLENDNENFRAIPNISINAALSKMDSISYPLVNIYIEDELSKKIIDKAINDITKDKHKFNHLVNLVIVGSADKAYNYFMTKSRLYKSENINCGYACVLDGDMRNQKDKNGNLKYPNQDLLFFHYSDEAPEKMLLRAFLLENHNGILSYHLNTSDAHVLFDKMILEGLCMDKDEAFNICFTELLKTSNGKEYFEELKNFLIDSCRYFSNDL